jgi:hypothetical protein
MITNVPHSIILEQFSRTERQLCGVVFGSRPEGVFRKRPLRGLHFELPRMKITVCSKI